MIDGTFELFRAFHSSDSKQVNGQEVGASIGFCRNVANLIIKDNAKYIAIAFDQVIESFRNELYDGYKTGEGIPEELWTQFPIIEKASELMGMVIWPMRELEADDALASASKRYQDQFNICICSPDKDLYQCVNDRVYLLDRIRSKTIGPAEVEEKFGIKPCSIPDLLALVGDKADGIPGIPKWGLKSSATILQAFTHIETIPKSPEPWPKLRGREGLFKSFTDHYENLELFKKLATLRFDVPLKEKAEDLRWKSVKPEFKGFCKEHFANTSTYQNLVKKS
ncbi:MAG: flap endonuclease [Oligoflexales bacterium]|nr:flap endonuclease [Oligoflexales bacterium]